MKWKTFLFIVYSVITYHMCNFTEARLLNKKSMTSKSKPSLSKSTKLGTPKPQEDANEAYWILAQYLTRYAADVNSSLREHSVEEVSQAIAALATSSQALKSLDGATHSFRNAFQER